MTFTPYLAFNGTCREAFHAYEKIFGGELFLITVGEAPPDAGLPEGAEPDAVLHAALNVDGRWIYGGDDPSGGFDGKVHGMCVSYAAKDVDACTEVFEALCDGGTVQLALAETFFSPRFGMCTDRFGVPWMISTERPQD